MAKDRIAVTCNGRTAFYACMYEDIRQCAMDCGWAVSLHGSLASDMDIMAMPWVENAVSFKEMVDRVSKLFKDNDMSSQYVITYNEKPHNRVVATIPIWLDFYLDISTIAADVVPKSEYDKLKEANAGPALALLYECEPTKEILAELEKTVREKVAREIFKEIDDKLNKARLECRSQLDTSGIIYINWARSIVAKIEKKYCINPCKWLFDEERHRMEIEPYICPVCHGYSNEQYKHCPNCGHEMEEADDAN